MPPRNIISDPIPQIDERSAPGTSDMENIPLSLRDISILNSLDEIHPSDFFHDSKGDTPMQEHDSSHHQGDDLSITRSLGLHHAYTTSSIYNILRTGLLLASRF